MKLDFREPFRVFTERASTVVYSTHSIIVEYRSRNIFGFVLVIIKNYKNVLG